MTEQSKIGGDVKAVVGLAAGLTLAGVAIGDSTLAIVLTFVVFILLLYAMARVPLRHTMFTLTFFVLALPNPAEGQATDWPPPFSVLGAILLNHLNTVDRSISLLSPLAFSGLDLIMVALFVIIIVRKSSGSKLDAGRVPTPKPMIRLAQLAIATALFTWVSGLVRGGDFGKSLWQVSCVAYLPMIFLLFQASYRGPKDHGTLLRILLIAAAYKCCLAVYIVYGIGGPLDPVTGSTRPPYGTSHNDSMLFATAFVVVLAAFVEGANRRIKWLALLFLPVLIIGTSANNRRLAWVQVGLVFLTVYLVSRETPLKRKLRRALFILAPVFAIYAMLGWESQYGSTFKPVRLIRSVIDAKSDGSSQWREFENVNIIATFRNNTTFGMGFGHPFEEVIVLPTVDYPLERYTPHNSLLGIWCYGGVVGFAGLSLLWMGGVYFAMRSYYESKEPGERIAALTSFGVVLVYLLQAWGDLGLGSITGVFLMGNALTVASKLAAANGQWTTKGNRNPAVGPARHSARVHGA